MVLRIRRRRRRRSVGSISVRVKKFTVFENWQLTVKDIRKDKKFGSKMILFFTSLLFSRCTLTCTNFRGILSISNGFD